MCVYIYMCVCTAGKPSEQINSFGVNETPLYREKKKNEKKRGRRRTGGESEYIYIYIYHA